MRDTKEEEEDCDITRYLVYGALTLVCFTLIADTRISLKPSRDIRSLINEFKGDTTMTIDSTVAVQKPFDLH